jgi:hypothetical protein
LVRVRRVLRTSLIATAICTTLGASGVLATMTWQAPVDSVTIGARTPTRPSVQSLVMTAADAYIDTRAAKLALQASTDADRAPSAKEERARKTREFALFERKCLKRVSKRRNARLVHVHCSPLQEVPADDTVAAAELTSPMATRLREAATFTR